MPKVERRLTTIVAADVAGYSRMIAHDEEATLLALATHRSELIDPLLSEHGGRVANTAGDSLLIEFPSAVSAMRCVIAFQKGMVDRSAALSAERRMEFRIGVNVGDVVVSGADLLGDGVNVAARLEQKAQPGEILISRSVRDAVRDRLELQLEDLGNITVKNIPRPVRTFRVLAGSAASGAPISARSAGALMNTIRARTALLVAILVCVAGAAWWFWPVDMLRGNTGPDRVVTKALGGRAIAVLPFEATGPGDADARLAAGLADDIAGVLTRFNALSVIASDSTRAYKPQVDAPRQLAEDLSVAHIVTGTVDRQGDTIRINVKLLDGETGRQVWSKRFDADGSDVFSLRDDVARSIGAQLGESFGPLAAETLSRSKRKDTETLEAYELVLLAAELRHRFRKEDNAEAAALLERAIALDPHYAHAHADLAWTHWQDVLNGYTDDPAASIQKAHASAETAVEADPYFSDAYWVLGALEICADDAPEDAVELYRKAIDLNPNHQSLLTEWGGYILPQTLDQADEGVRLVERARDLNPHHPDWYDGAYVAALLFAERPQDAIAAYASVDQPQLSVRVYYAAALGHAGRAEDARPVIEKIRELTPEFSLSTFQNSPDLCVGAMTDRALTYLRDGLRKAGLPS